MTLKVPLKEIDNEKTCVRARVFELQKCKEREGR